MNEEATTNPQNLQNNEISATGNLTEKSEKTGYEAILYSEPVFKIGDFNVTNSLVSSWVVVIAIVVLSIVIKRSLKKIPKGIQNGVEILTEGAMNLADTVTGDRKKTEKVLPLVLAIFLFILLNNWLGLLPGVGSIGYMEKSAGHSVFVPFLRGGTADLNTTLALGLFSVLGANVFGIFIVGFFRHLNKFVGIKLLAEIPKKVFKDFSVIFVNPIKFFVGLIEIVGEVAKVASLSFRLFGNVFAGEVLLASLSVLFAFFLPIPFIFLEIIVGIIQALIFSMLTLVYFTISSTVEEH